MNNLYLIKSGDNGFVEETSAVISAEGGDISINGGLNVDSAGNIGIGTSSPDNKLDVVGSADISSDLTVNNIVFTNVGGQSPAAANDIIKYDGNSWVVAAASTLPGGGGGGAGNSDVPAGLINTLTQGESIHEVNFGFDSNNDRIVYDNVPKIAASLEIDGPGEIIPHTVSGVSESGYFVVFSEELPTANYRMHTVFGGTDAFWETGVANLEYSERNVEIDRSLYVGQKVGIGTTNPNDSLEVKKDGARISIDSDDYNLIKIGRKSSTLVDTAYLRLRHEGEDRIVFDSDGKSYIKSDNVGIGTTNPQRTLTVDGGTLNVSTLFLSSDAGSYISFMDNSTTDDTQALIGAKGNDLSLYAGGELGIHIKENANVGIGTTNPTSPLHVKTSGTGGTLVIESDDDGSAYAPDFLLFRNSESPAVDDNLGEIKFRGRNDDDPQSSIDYAMIRSRIKDPANNSEKGELTFWTRGGASLKQRMVLDSSGNVGIGTTSPVKPLEVQYNSGAIYSSGVSGNALRLRNIKEDTTSSHCGIDLFAGVSTESGNNPLARIYAVRENNTDGKCALTFATRSTSSVSEAMRIDSDGNVGIGTTNPTAQLFIKGSQTNDASISISADNSDGEKDASIFFNATRGVNNAGSNGEIRVTHDGGSGLGKMLFATRRGTGDPTTAMTIDSDGDVLIATQNDNVQAANSGTADRDGLNYKAGDNYLALARSSTGGALFINKSDETTNEATNYIVFKNTGSLTGEIEYNGTDVVISQTSDERSKTNIKNSESGLNIVNGLQVRSFDWVDNARKSKKFGFVAQEMHSVFEDAVRVGGEDLQEDPWAIYESTLIPVLTKAIQEQQQMIEDLKSEIEQLKS